MRVLFIYAIASTVPPVSPPVEICGDSDALLVSEVGGKNALDIFLPAKAAEVKVFDRGNYQSNISFSVTKLHNTIGDALIYQRKHPRELAHVGVLQLENVHNAPSGEEWHYIKGGFQSVSVKAAGACTIATYSFVGGLPSSTSLNPDPL